MNTLPAAISQQIASGSMNEYTQFIIFNLKVHIFVTVIGNLFLSLSSDFFTNNYNKLFCWRVNSYRPDTNSIPVTKLALHSTPSQGTEISDGKALG